MMGLATLEYAKPLQVDTEMFELVELIKREGVRSYLEIGARYGGSFERIMMAMGKSARGVWSTFRAEISATTIPPRSC
jgi:hypothetical protein